MDESIWIEQYRYDPEKGEVVLVRKGASQPVNPQDLSPRLRERFEKFLAEHGDKRKSA